MQDLSKMTVKQLCDAYVIRVPWDAVVAELTRRIENAAPHHGWRTVPPKGYVLCDDGVARKVLGTLPMTADECLLGIGASVYVQTAGGARYAAMTTAYMDIRQDFVVIHPEVWHSTREAAEAARAKEAK